ncbi:MAG: hypothetical protein ACYSSP_01440 [Planctomycetota bacterium]
MKRIAILVTLIVMLGGFVFVIGCESGSAKATAEDEVIQASAYAEGAEAVKACDPGCDKPCCDKDPSSCPKAASGCPKAAAAASGCSK